MDILYPEQKNRIRQIIERSRFGEEMFFHDSAKATDDVISYLQEEGVLVARVIPLKEKKSKQKNKFL